MAIDETRLALLEQKFISLANRQDKSEKWQEDTDDWINEHKMEELTRHNTIMNAIGSVQKAIEVIQQKGPNRWATADRFIVVISTLITLCTFGFIVYNQLNGTPIAVP
jgi:hypothetical protein